MIVRYLSGSFLQDAATHMNDIFVSAVNEATAADRPPSIALMYKGFQRTMQEVKSALLA